MVGIGVYSRIQIYYMNANNQKYTTVHIALGKLFYQVINDSVSIFYYIYTAFECVCFLECLYAPHESNIYTKHILFFIHHTHGTHLNRSDNTSVFFGCHSFYIIKFNGKRLSNNRVMTLWIIGNAKNYIKPSTQIYIQQCVFLFFRGKYFRYFAFRQCISVKITCNLFKFSALAGFQMESPFVSFRLHVGLYPLYVYAVRFGFITSCYFFFYSSALHIHSAFISIPCCFRKLKHAMIGRGGINLRRLKTFGVEDNNRKNENRTVCYCLRFSLFSSIFTP